MVIDVKNMFSALVSETCDPTVELHVAGRHYSVDPETGDVEEI